LVLLEWPVLQLQETLRAQDRADRHFLDDRDAILAKELAARLQILQWWQCDGG
jgi:hypothetical protein